MWHKDNCMDENVRAVTACEEKMKLQDSRRVSVVTVFLREETNWVLKTGRFSSLWRKGQMSYAKVYEGKQELSHNPVRHVSRSHCSVDAGKDCCTSQAESKLTLPQYWLRRTVPRGITSNIVWQALNLSAILQEKWELARVTLDESHTKLFSHSCLSTLRFMTVEFSLTSPLVWLKVSFSFVVLLPVCFQLVWLPLLAQRECQERGVFGAVQPAPSVAMESRCRLHAMFHKNAFNIFLHRLSPFVCISFSLV